MADPFCTFPWTWEGFREVAVYNAAGLAGDRVRDVCRALSDASVNATSVDALREALAEACKAHGLAVGLFRIEPDHGHPLGTLISVSVIRSTAPRG